MNVLLVEDLEKIYADVQRRLKDLERLATSFGNIGLFAVSQRLYDVSNMIDLNMMALDNVKRSYENGGYADKVDQSAIREYGEKDFLGHWVNVVPHTCNSTPFDSSLIRSVGMNEDYKSSFPHSF
jgi:hypothetical protein